MNCQINQEIARFATFAAARRHLIATGYRLIPGKWWQNDNVAGAASCLLVSRSYDGDFKVIVG